MGRGFEYKESHRRAEICIDTQTNDYSIHLHRPFPIIQALCRDGRKITK